MLLGRRSTLQNLRRPGKGYEGEGRTEGSEIVSAQKPFDLPAVQKAPHSGVPFVLTLAGWSLAG